MYVEACTRASIYVCMYVCIYCMYVEALLVHATHVYAM